MVFLWIAKKTKLVRVVCQASFSIHSITGRSWSNNNHMSAFNIGGHLGLVHVQNDTEGIYSSIFFDNCQTLK